MDKLPTSHIEGSLTCPSCRRELPSGLLFCGFDGSVLTTSPESATADRQCPQCHGQLPAYAAYCPQDGSRLPPRTPAPPSLTDQPATFQPPVKTIDDSDEFLGNDSADDWLWGDENLVGMTIADKYRIEELLGRGGMAEVYRATHLNMGKNVVIKIMHANLCSQVSSLKRFEQECRVTAKIDHPNIVSVYDTGVFEGQRPYLVMEFIKGESLRDRLNRQGTMTFAQAAEVLIPVCSGLQEAHLQGIVHRDLKPENIMLRDTVDRGDWVKVVDFGIARLKEGNDKLTKSGMTIGTMDYLSPEYLRDQTIDQRSDIYALGIILYEMLTGQCPFVAHTSIGVAAKHLWGTIEQPSKFCSDTKSSGTIDMLVHRCLEKDPQHRYQSALDLRNALVDALTSLQ